MSIPFRNPRIDAIVREHPVVLFMKGSALFPQCGFSSSAVAILDRLGVTPHTVDVLQDPEMRALIGRAGAAANFMRMPAAA